jgi:hypothetical protein
MRTPPTEMSPDTESEGADPGQGADRPGAQQSSSLKLINMSIGPDRKGVHLHFLTHGGQILTVQLEANLASRFYRGLGRILTQIDDAAADNDIPQWH